MGGGSLALSYKSGGVAAYFDAYADFLINYRPFTFTADFGVHVGASYHGKLGCIHYSISVDLSADLNLIGPPVSGSVKINLKVMKVTIHFGDSNPPNKALPWADFCTLLLQGETVDHTQDAAIGQGFHKIKGATGVVSNNSGDDAVTQSEDKNPWTVDARTFSLSFTTLFPMTTVTDEGSKFQYTSSTMPYMKPMRIATTTKNTPTSVVSAVSMSIYELNADGSDPPESSRIYPVFSIAPIISNAPSAVWGPCE